MFLQSVTLRGFKSFADKTTLEFEPGITVVVGPNGSGKSNVVDALTWVLGTHSPKTLRGGAMADVIFAGAPGRPGLGRAAVEIRIDNSAGTLPIEFAEVTISRAMYASGENEYAINGVPCRLLDVSELLSDTGLGRENHTIVGQGRLDEILNARPEERRAFIEEAAGILKHRRRKERALRKLSQLEDHLQRSADVLRELRRQLRPLERQAEAAAKHAQLQARRDELVRARTLRELDRLDLALVAARETDERLGARAAALTAELDGLRGGEAAMEEALAAGEPRARQVATTHVRLSTAVERFHGLVGRIEERRQGLLAVVEEPVAGRDPAALRAEADDAQRAADEMADQLAASRRALERCEVDRGAAEQARRAHEQAAAAEARRRAEVRERRLRWEGQVSALQSALAQAAGEDGRLAAQIAGLEDRAAGLSEDVEEAQAEIRRLDAATPALTARLADADARLVRRTDAVDDLTMAERELERERASLRARAEALRATAAHADEGGAAVLEGAESGRLDGVLGPLSAHLRVDPTMGPAVTRALERLGSAVVVAGREEAHRALEFAAAEGAQVRLLAAGVGSAPRDGGRDASLAQAGARPLVDVVTAPPEVADGLSWALRDVYVVADLRTAAALADVHPEAVFVTVDGQSAGSRGWVGGTATEPTTVLALAGAEEAERRLAGVEAELEDVLSRLSEADTARGRARDEVDAATVVLQESDGRITAAAERLRRLEAELARCQRELRERRAHAGGLADDMAGLRARLDALEARGVEEPEGAPDGPDIEAERLEDALASTREAEVQARLEVRSAQERHAGIVRRVAALRAEAEQTERQLAEQHSRRRARMAALDRCAQLLPLADEGHRRAAASLSAAEVQRQVVEGERAARREELGALRARVRELDGEVSRATTERHGAAIERQGLESAVAAVRERAAADDTDLDRLLADARRQRHEGSGPLHGGQEREAEIAAALSRVERQLGLIGDVNPLARREHERLTERLAFLEGELADVRASRDDLLEVIEAVDARIREVFAAAFADVAAAFDGLVPRLFPGGEGRLVLTNPDDLLTSGVEVEVRPAGKRVKRLSLLSGGERSLAALAVTFAIFVARPSPFYVLDEVEAALDDVNLQRFLDVVTDFRASSQLILVSHQKRTMEIADLLYGVTMQDGGVSRVLGQRIADLVPG